jgi:tetratricopeptide (TPR) repeat protein
MTPQARWRRIQELAEGAEAQPEPQRAFWMETAEPDPALRDEAFALLAALSAEARANAQGVAALPPLFPERIGPYRILQPAGSGGRGTVFRAAREVAGAIQEVALKLLRDSLVTPADLDRFRREQRILAGLRHPSIARFLDAGIDEQGRAYLALEWIDGQPLDRHAASLPLRARVRLMVEALDALHAAHQSLVVHLDVKPSNILVDDTGRVRLIDFGTAKLIDEQGFATQTHQFTPIYASPEQLRGEPASTASDIYSAALTFRQLLTGEPPARSSLVALAERATTDAPAVRYPEEPDLEAVLQKALHFVPASRYRSAAEFADDLRAWLGHRPVHARRPTAFYRAQRFLRRHYPAVSFTAIMVVALAAFGVSAFREQQLRLREAERGASIAAFLRGMIDSSATAASGKPRMTVLEMVERAHQRIENGAPLPADVAALLQSDFAYFARESGNDEQAERIARSALRRADANGDPEARLTARRALAETAIRLGRCDEAVRLYREADTLWAQRNGRWKPALESSYLGARATAKSRCETDPEGAVGLLELAVRRAAAVSPADTAFAPAVLRASLHNALALELARLRRFDDARAALAAGIREADSHEDARYLRVALRRVLGQVESNAGRHEQALAAFEQALATAPGVANPFEELRLQFMAAGQQADLGRGHAAIARTRDAVARIHPERHGAARWMLFADAAEVMARAGACPEADLLYRQVDELTGGQIPRDWRGNRLFHTAACVAGADPPRAASLAAQAMEAYGPLLRPDSPRRRRLESLIAGKK